MCNDCKSAIAEARAELIKLRGGMHRDWLLSWALFWLYLWIARMPTSARQSWWVDPLCWANVGWVAHMLFTQTLTLKRERRFWKEAEVDYARFTQCRCPHE